MLTLGAALLLNGLLSAENWWPTPLLWPDTRLAPEFVLFWTVLLLVQRFTGGISERMVSVMAGAYFLVAIGRYLDVTSPALFGRPIKLYWDGQLGLRFLWATFGQWPGWLIAAVLLALFVLVWLAFHLARRGFARLAFHAVPPASRSRWAKLATAFALGLVVANFAGVRATWPIISKPVLPTWIEQIELVFSSMSSEAIARSLPDSPKFDSNLNRLAGADLKLFFLETYGALVYDESRANKALTSSRSALLAAITDSGRQVLSARLRSPTFGGGSDLAQLGLLAGVDLSEPRNHDLFLSSGRATLLSHFEAHGYQTAGVYPALSWDWPEKSVYGYDLFADGRDLGWRGKPFTYWKLPDQFSIARFEQLHPIGPETPPRLLVFASINSHLPFAPVPPYQADWERILTDMPFDSQREAQALARTPNWPDLFFDYVRSIDYTYEWLAGYMRRPTKRPDFLILLGDHQPVASVTGPGASWDVPVHLISADPALLQRFQAYGFVPGLVPAPASRGDLHQLTQWLLDAFSDGPANAGSAAVKLPPGAAG